VAQIFSRRVQRGVSLIEVLIAVLIFCIGLIGLAGLLVMATRSNHAAYVRTQVSFLANNMADRMRANPIGLWTNAYDGTASPIAATTPMACDTSTSCTPAQIAVRDQQIWSGMLTTLLPGVAGTSIACNTAIAGAVPTAQIPMRPPYGGSCTMIIKWAEQGLANGDSHTTAATLQSFTWVFQP
jgi:type IV pilus assembly protein PilV